MILIADSGSTKTEWALLDPVTGDSTESVLTRGLNPFFVTIDEIAGEVKDKLLPRLPKGAEIEKVYFYGSGVRPEKQGMIREGIQRVLSTEVEAATDMLGAARALCGQESGIASILGTGANSCLYDGSEITQNVPPLGFILGDEGSGAWIGGHFLADLLKGLYSPEVEAAFRERYPGLDAAGILTKVYSEPSPNRFLASFAPFVCEMMKASEEGEKIRRMVGEGFRAFVLRNVLLYPDAHLLPISFAGSIAYYFQDELAAAIAEEGLTIGRILAKPMTGLLEYHRNLSRL